MTSREQFWMALFYAFVIAVSIVLPILGLSIFIPKWMKASRLSFKDVVSRELEKMSPNEQNECYCL